MIAKHLLIFDLDGTILQTGTLDTNLYTQVLQEVYQQPISTNWSEYQASTHSGIFAEVFHKMFSKPPTHNDIRTVQDVYEHKLKNLLQYPNLCTATNGIHEFLNAIEKHPYYYSAIATGGWKNQALYKLKHAFLHISCLPIATADDHIHRPDIIKTAIERATLYYKQNFERVTYFGDGIWDKNAAEKLGIHFMAVGDNKCWDNVSKKVVDFENQSEIFSQLENR